MDSTCLLIAQDSSDGFKIIYGLDPTLYNGKIYSYFVTSNVNGDPYFSSNDFQLGSLTTRGIEYKNLRLNYDVINQKLILQFSNLVGGLNVIEVSDAWLEGFKFGGYTFKILPDNNNTKQIYQVLGTDSIGILYHWKKILVLENITGIPNYKFQGPEREAFVFMHHMLNQYKNNRSFLHTFDPVRQVIIKKYLREHRVNLKRANDQEVLELVKLCNNP